VIGQTEQHCTTPSVSYGAACANAAGILASCTAVRTTSTDRS
jgi:hypothetical protein